MTFCPECGSELKGDAHFCNNCGSKIGIDNVKEETPKNDIKKPKTKNKKISIIALISIAGLLIILLLYILSPVNVDEKNEGQSENKRPIADAGGDKIYYINQLGGISAGFNGSSSTDEDISSLTYEWDFGEGDEKEYGILTYNTYTKYGTYNVTLKVIDKYGLNDTDTIKISILQSIELNVLNHGYTYQNNSDDEYYDEYYVQLTLSNIGDGTVEITPSLFSLKTTGFTGRYSHDDGSAPESLGPNDSATFNVYFEVEKYGTPTQVIYGNAPRQDL